MVPAEAAAGAPVKQWVETLEKLSVELEDLTRDTERQFEESGAKISGFIETVNRLSAELSALGRFIAGDVGQNAAEALKEALALSEEMTERWRGNNRALSQMHQEANRVRRTLAGFGGIVASFQSLGVLTRIETARLGCAGADFGSLAEDVRLLAKTIQTKVEGALDTASELVPQIQSDIEQAAALRDGQMRELPKIAERGLASLALFRRARAHASAVSAQLSKEYREVSEAFTKLIISMQFTDITRQQIEHVVAAFRRLITPSGGDGILPLHHYPKAAGALELQSQQLVNAHALFKTSVDSILMNLGGIARHVEGMAKESQSLMGASDSGEGSPLEEMQSGCALILSGLKTCALADEAAAASSGGLLEKTARMRTAVEEIQKIETQMKRIAMNARISAMQLGPAGEALSSLSDSIKQRAFESSQTSDLLIEALQLMGEIARDWNEQSRLALERREARNACLRSIEMAFQNLRSSRGESTQQIESILLTSDALRSDILDRRTQLTNSLRFETVLERSEKQIHALIGEIKMHITESAAGEAVDLSEFTSSYTMKSERDVYAGTASSADDGIEFF